MRHRGFRIVLSKDLNHHGTLFAGQMALWIVETCLIKAVKLTGRANNLVCVNIKDLTFKHPVNKGEIVDIEPFVKAIGKTSLTIGAFVFVDSFGDQPILETAITFVVVDKKGNPEPHHISIES
jgi:acyl-CoA hydrolase